MVYKDVQGRTMNIKNLSEHDWMLVCTLVSIGVAILVRTLR